MKFCLSIVAIVSIMALIVSVVPMVPGERDSLHVELTMDETEYKEGDAIQFTVHVLDKGIYVEADNVTVKVYRNWYNQGENVSATQTTTGHYGVSYTVPDDTYRVVFEIEVERGTDSEYIEHVIYIAQNELEVSVIFDHQWMMTVGPGEEVTAAIIVRYKEDLVDADDFAELYIENPDDERTNLTSIRLSTGVYSVTYTMPNAAENGEYMIYAHVEYANMHGYGMGYLILNVLNVWYQEISLTGGTLTFRLGVSDLGGIGINGAQITLAEPQELTQTTTGNGTAVISLTNVWDGMWVEGWVVANGKNQSFDGSIDIGEDGINPAHHRLDIIYVGNQDQFLYRPNTQVTRTYQAFNDTVPLPNKVIYYYVVHHAGSIGSLLIGGTEYLDFGMSDVGNDVLAYGAATTDELGRFEVSFTPSEEGMSLVYFEAGMPPHHNNYNPPHYPDYDLDDGLVYEAADGWGDEAKDYVFLSSTTLWDDKKIEIETGKLVVGGKTLVTITLPEGLDHNEMVIGVWGPGESEALPDAFEATSWEPWTDGANMIRLKPTDDPKVYEGYIVIPSFMSKDEEYTIMTGYVDDSGTGYGDHAVLSEGESLGGDEGLGSMVMWLAIIIIALVVVIIIAMVLMRKKGPEPAQAPGQPPQPPASQPAPPTPGAPEAPADTPLHVD